MASNIITVLLPANKVDSFLYSALDSICNQSFESFVVILLLNGGVKEDDLDGNRIDRNLVVVEETDFKNLVDTLNYGISISRSEVIARMDADDIAHRDRLQVQYEYMVRGGLDVVGCNIRLIDSAGRVKGSRQYPESNSACEELLLYGAPLCHPAVLCRAEVLRENRYHHVVAAEDLDLWRRLAGRVKFGNVPLELLDYRVHSSQISSSLRKEALLANELSSDAYKRFQSGELSRLAVMQSVMVLPFKHIFSAVMIRYIINYPFLVKVLLLRLRSMI